MTKNKNTSLKRAGRLFQYLKPYRIEFYFGLFFLLLSTVASLIFPALMGNLVDSASDKLVNNINQIAIALLVLFALQAIFSYFKPIALITGGFTNLDEEKYNTLTHLVNLPKSS